MVVAAFLSQDKVLYKELNDGIDLHSDNQVKLGLPDRITAKIFIFKLMFGAMEYSFAQDPDFTFISTKPKYWREVIDRYYDKYQGIKEWHESIIQQVAKDSKLVTPFGRTFVWDLMQYGEYKIPTTQVKNYPVQGTGSDVVMIARVALFKRLLAKNIVCDLICTVHDSIVIDCKKEYTAEIIKTVEEVFQDLPNIINKLFDINWDLEVRVEIKTGMDLYNLKEIE